MLKTAWLTGKPICLGFFACRCFVAGLMPSWHKASAYSLSFLPSCMNWRPDCKPHK
jgi:hypothetical protein